MENLPIYELSKNNYYFNKNTIKYLFYGSIGCATTFIVYKKIKQYHYKKAINNSINILNDGINNYMIKNNNPANNKIYILLNNLLSNKDIENSVKKFCGVILKDIIINLSSDRDIINVFKENINKLLIDYDIQNYIYNFGTNLLLQEKTQNFLENYFVFILGRPKVNNAFSNLVNTSICNFISNKDNENKIENIVNNSLKTSGSKWRIFKKIFFGGGGTKTTNK